MELVNSSGWSDEYFVVNLIISIMLATKGTPILKGETTSSMEQIFLTFNYYMVTPSNIMFF